MTSPDPDALTAAELVGAQQAEIARLKLELDASEQHRRTLAGLLENERQAWRTENERVHRRDAEIERLSLALDAALHPPTGETTP